MPLPRSPLDRLPPRPADEQERLAVWWHAMYLRAREQYPSLRRQLLDAAQRAQDARAKVIG